MFSKNSRIRKSKTTEETQVFVDTATCHEEPNSRLDKNPTVDKYGVEGERLISAEPPIISALVAQKKKSRASKNKYFNCFVIDRVKINPQTGLDELKEFLIKLNGEVKSLPNPTRFQLNVFDRGHWYPIDFYIKDGQVNSFILDAVGDPRYKKTLNYIGQLFPQGNHYYFHVDNEFNSSAKNKRVSELIDSKYDIQPKYVNLASMQKSDIGCRVFSAYHAMNMANSDPEELYSALNNSCAPTVRNLPPIYAQSQVVDQLYVEEKARGAVTLRSIKPDQSLVRLIRPTQSYTQLNALDQDVRDLEITTEKGGTTLERHGQESRENVGGRNVNATILNKSQKYREKILKFKNQYSEREIDSYMEHRSGFAYLQTPDLFKLDEFISVSEKDNVLDAAMMFFNSFYENMPKTTSKSFLGMRLDAKNLNLSQQSLLDIEELITLYKNDEISKGEFVSSFMLQIQELQDKLIENNSVRTLKEFKSAIHQAAYFDEDQPTLKL